LVCSTEKHIYICSVCSDVERTGVIYVK
jgi:hypothetical protein